MNNNSLLKKYHIHLNEVAFQFNQSLPTEFQSDFKVFDFDLPYYKIEPFKNDSTLDSLSLLVNNLSKYYLIIARRPIKNGSYENLVFVKLPSDRGMAGVSPVLRVFMQGLVRGHLSNSSDPSEITNGVIKGMGRLKDFIVYKVICCKVDFCCECITKLEVQDLLRDRGMYKEADQIILHHQDSIAIKNPFDLPKPKDMGPQRPPEIMHYKKDFPLQGINIELECPAYFNYVSRSSFADYNKTDVCFGPYYSDSLGNFCVEVFDKEKDINFYPIVYDLNLSKDSLTKVLERRKSDLIDLKTIVIDGVESKVLYLLEKSRVFKCIGHYKSPNNKFVYFIIRGNPKKLDFRDKKSIAFFINTEKLVKSIRIRDIK